MAYKTDKDLEFLREMSDTDLDSLVGILTTADDGKKRYTESITSNKKYQKYNPQHSKYVSLILEEVQSFGGHTVVNMFRKSGVQYKEILCDVCEKQKVNFNKESKVEVIEKNLLDKISIDVVENLSEDDKLKLAKDLNIDVADLLNNKAMAGLAITTAFKQGGFKSYQILVTVSNGLAKNLLGRGLPFAVNSGLTKAASIVNPLLMAVSTASLISDIASPAYRVTVPATINIAILRSIYKERKANSKEEAVV